MIVDLLLSRRTRTTNNTGLTVKGKNSPVPNSILKLRLIVSGVQRYKGNYVYVLSGGVNGCLHYSRVRYPWALNSLGNNFKIEMRLGFFFNKGKRGSKFRKEDILESSGFQKLSQYRFTRPSGKEHNRLLKRNIVISRILLRYFYSSCMNLTIINP